MKEFYWQGIHCRGVWLEYAWNCSDLKLCCNIFLAFQISYVAYKFSGIVGLITYMKRTFLDITKFVLFMTFLFLFHVYYHLVLGSAISTNLHMLHFLHARLLKHICNNKQSPPSHSISLIGQELQAFHVPHRDLKKCSQIEQIFEQKYYCQIYRVIKFI